MARTGTVVALLLAAVLLVGPVVTALGPTNPSTPLLLGLVLAALVVVLLYRRRGARDDGDASSWESIPRWQYDGRFAEAGGLTRDEQERAIERVQEDASRRN